MSINDHAADRAATAEQAAVDGCVSLRLAGPFEAGVQPLVLNVAPPIPVEQPRCRVCLARRWLYLLWVPFVSVLSLVVTFVAEPHLHGLPHLLTGVFMVCTGLMSMMLLDAARHVSVDHGEADPLEPLV